MNLWPRDNRANARTSCRKKIHQIIENAYWLAVALLIICFIQALIINIHSSFRCTDKLIEWFSCVLGTLKCLEIGLIVVLPILISYNVAQNQRAINGIYRYLCKLFNCCNTDANVFLFSTDEIIF